MNQTQLHPTENFPITYVLGDPNDTATYYVQAVIYDDILGTTIDTVNLTDLGSGRFKKAWQVCSDVSGEGRYISIVVKVYTDSGYTTLSAGYQQEESKYLVQERWNRGNLGSAPNFSYKEIRKIIQEELGKIPKTELPKTKEVDFSEVYKQLKGLNEGIKGIKFPEIKETDLSGINKNIDKVKKAVDSIHIPPQKEVDFEPVFSEVRKIKEGEISEVKNGLLQTLERMKGFFMDDIEQLKEKLEELNKMIKEGQIVVLKQNKQNESI